MATGLEILQGKQDVPPHLASVEGGRPWPERAPNPDEPKPKTLDIKTQDYVGKLLKERQHKTDRNKPTGQINYHMAINDLPQPLT